MLTENEIQKIVSHMIFKGYDKEEIHKFLDKKI